MNYFPNFLRIVSVEIDFLENPLLFLFVLVVVVISGPNACQSSDGHPMEFVSMENFTRKHKQ